MSVVVTGYGAVSPLGQGVEALWSGMLEGRSGARALAATDPGWEDLPVRVGAPVTADLEAALERVPHIGGDRVS